MTRKRAAAATFASLTVLAALTVHAQQSEVSAIPPANLFRRANPDANAAMRLEAGLASTRSQLPAFQLLPPTTYDTGGFNPWGVAIADVNKDGKPDLIVTNQGTNLGEGSVGVLLGNGNGTFKPAVDYDSGGVIAYAVTLADVNHDGIPDIIVANACASGTFCSPEGAIGVLLGNGDGTFKPPESYGTGGYSFFIGQPVVADVNGDGKPDLIVPNFCDVLCDPLNPPLGSVGVLLGNGDGTFKPAVAYSAGGFYTWSIAVADLNGDGKPDVVLTNFCGSSPCAAPPLPDAQVGVLLGNGDGTFQPVVTYDSGGAASAAVAIADVNRDGIPDVLVANCGIETCGPGSLAGSVAVLLGNGDGTLQGPVSYPAGNSPDALVILDMNGDGKLDVVVGDWGTSDGSSNNGSVAILLGNGDGTFQAPQIFLSGGNEVPTIAVADLNGDGKPDIVAGSAGSNGSNPPPGVVSVLLNGTAFSKSSTSTSLVSSLNHSTYGQKVTFTATVAGDGVHVPTGRVSFVWGIHAIGGAALNSGGVATLTTSILNADTYPLTAVYKGDATNLGSNSPLVLQVVQPAVSSAVLSSSPNPSKAGQLITFTATITSPTAKPSGPVTFSAGKAILGKISLTAGKATLTTSSLPAGSTRITATFAGDSNIKGSSASVTQVVH